MKVLTVTNQKGGVGKTAVALHLAFAGKERGLRVLLIDLDTQGNAGATLAGDPALPQQDGGATTLFTHDRPEPRQTPAGIDLLHGHQRLDDVDTRFTFDDVPPLRRRVRGLPYDLIVFDTPPAIGLRHVAPLVWSDACLTPLAPTGFSVAGLTQTFQTLAVAQRLNPRLRRHVIINRHVRSSKQHTAYLEQLESRIALVRPYLVQRIAVADALDAGVPVWRFRRATHDTKHQWKTLCEGFVHDRAA